MGIAGWCAMTTVLSRYLSVGDVNAKRVASYVIEHSASFTDAARKLQVTPRTLMRWRADGGPLAVGFPLQAPLPRKTRCGIGPDGRTYLYAILNEDRVVYIGQTQHPEKRPLNHLAKGIGTEGVIFRAYNSLGDALAAESRAISFLKHIGVPINNVHWQTSGLSREERGERVSATVRA